MNVAKVISVNPCARTRGEFNFCKEALEYMTRSIAPSEVYTLAETRKKNGNILMKLARKTVKIFKHHHKESTEMDYRAYNKI